MARPRTGESDPRAAAEGDPRAPRRRLAALLDRGPVLPLRTPGGHSDGPGLVATAVRGRIDGRPVVAFCTDGSRRGGALGPADCDAIVAAIDTAVRDGCPVVGLWHSGGAKLSDGIEALEGFGRVFSAIVRASGRVPQISVVVGPAAGGAAYGPALTDVIIMAPGGRLFVTGPDVVRKVTGEHIDMTGLGGPLAHGRKSGVAHIVAASEADAYGRARRVAALLSHPGLADQERAGSGVDPGSLLPAAARRAYDMRPVIQAIVDHETGGPVFEEFQRDWAANIIVGLARLGGRTVGVVANNPIRKAGCLDSLSAEKGARFVRMCDALGLPLVVLVDVPGYLPGVRQEWDGVIRRGAKLVHAFAAATVPRVTLVLRKSHGGAYIAMNSRSLGADTVLAWPQADVAVMGASAAVEILHRSALAAAGESERPALLASLVEHQEAESGGVRRGIASGAVDAIIEPADTRARLIAAVAATPAARGQHDNIPL
ncbi:propionyl-CoA carboxylase subunit beta [Pseudofrankia sp. BMG5.36]|nr:propionyl-CoA carboxylase subunit beta [Pseudofrankia sp. BMG5.36]